MKTLQFPITIQAPRERVWETTLAPDTYQQWTAAFGEGSYYEGSWEEGSSILFLGPSGEGMKAVIAANRPLQRLSIRHLAFIIREKEDPFTEPIFENYTFRDAEGGTELLVELDCLQAWEAMFQETWPRALQLLKGLCEARHTRPQS